MEKKKVSRSADDDSSKQCQKFEGESINLAKKILNTVDKDLVVPKLSFFFFFMATGAFLPYLGVFYKQLWLTARQSGILLGVRPFVKMLCSPLWGMVTDVCNKPKLILLVSILGTTVAHFSQSIVSPFHLPCYPDVNRTNFSQIRSNLFAQYSTDRSSRQSGFPATSTRLQENSLVKGADQTNYSSAENAGTTVRGSMAPEKFLRNNDFNKQKEVGKEVHPFDYGTAQEESMEDTGPRHDDKPREITDANSKILTKNKKRKNPNMKNDFRVKDNQSIFATLLVIVFLGEFIAAPAPMLTDSGTLGILSGREHQYGRQRLFGSVGWGIGSLLSGAVVTAFNSCPYEDSINYVACFYVFAGAMILDFFVGLFFNFVPAPSKQDVSNMENEFLRGLKIFYNLKNGAFICTLLFLGFSHSLQLSFLFWFLQDIGGTPILFTLIVAVNCLSEVVMFFLATYFVQKIGHDAVLYTGLACYGLRFLLYSYLNEPWWVLPLEALQGFTYGGVWTASVAYVGPQPGSGATIQGIIHGVYWGLGMAVGGVIGGLMVHSIGARLTFRLEAALSFAILVLFFAINNFHQKNSQYSQIPSEPAQDPGDEKESASENDDNHDEELEDSRQSTWRRAIQRVRHIDKSFLVSKAFYFFFYTALGSLFPFFSLYYKQLWLTPGQIGLLLALRPAVKLVCLPLWKMVTDRFSRPKVVYFISIFGWIIGYYGQSFVFPTKLPCYGSATEISAIQDIAFSTPASNINRLNSTAKSSNITTRELTLNKHLSTFVQKWDPKSYQKLSKIKKTDRNLLESVVKSEDASSKAKRLTWSQLNGHYANIDTDAKSRKRSFVQRSESTFNLFSREDASVDDFRQVINDPQNDNRGKKLVLKSDSAQENIVTKHKNNELRPYETVNDMQRSPRPSEDFRVKYNTWVFRTLILIVILTEIITTPTPMLADNAIVRSLVETDSVYGKQRLFGSLGLSLAAILVAVWVSLETDCVHTDTINYVPCFHLFEIAIGATVLVSLCVEFNRPLEENPNEFDFKDAMKLFKNFKNGVFIVTLFLFGCFHSLQNSFLFWYLQDLGGTPTLFSVILLIYCLAEVVMYFISGYVGEAIGQQGIICLAFACYTARYLMYSYLKDPWLVIPMEMVQGITYGGVWSIATVYVNAPPEATPMVQSILHGSYWGLGMALGSGISGVIIDFTSPRSMFLVAAAICFLLCMFHLGIDIYNKMKALEEEQAQRLAVQRGEAKPSKSHESAFIGAAAAPLVPCLLYGR